MISQMVRTYWWLILVLATLAAGMVLSESSNQQVQRAGMLLMIYSLAVAIVWLRVRLALQPPTPHTLQAAFQSWRSFVVRHLPFVIREK
jgi:FtsH-binding integral membrane protein